MLVPLLVYFLPKQWFVCINPCRVFAGYFIVKGPTGSRSERMFNFTLLIEKRAGLAATF